VFSSLQNKLAKIDEPKINQFLAFYKAREEAVGERRLRLDLKVDRVWENMSWQERNAVVRALAPFWPAGNVILEVLDLFRGRVVCIK
jgi:hypothetical protein